jgi:indole-3-glycerol phosphate synthase
MPFLDEIIESTEREVDAAKKERSVRVLRRMISKAPEVNSFAGALGDGRFGIIAELKKRSPSAGEMREDNFKQAPAVYAKSPIVKAVSVLTNFSHFGMSIDEISRVRPLVRKPILRKDFIIKQYQVFEARAFGADAILLMANVLSKTNLHNLFDLASELKLDVLFEIHDESEISKIPDGAKIYGVNSRKFMATHRWRFARLLLKLGFGKSNKAPDPSVEMATFNLINKLPKNAIKVAESGVKPSRLSQIANMGYDSALIGTSILKSPDGVERVISEFEKAISSPVENIPAASPVPA